MTSARSILRRLFPTGKVAPLQQLVAGCLPFQSYGDAEQWVAKHCEYPVGIVLILDGKPIRTVFYSRYQSTFVRHMTQSEAL